MSVEKSVFNLDLTIPSTVTRTNKSNVVLLSDPQEETTKLCAKHERERKGKEEKAKINNGPTKVNALQKVFGKSALQRKLDYRNIKIKVGFNHKRKISPTDGERQDGHKFSISELKYFNSSQLKIIQETMQKQIDILTKDMTDLTEENERHASDKDGLKMTVANFEELALRVMKPWVNIMPNSDEMTRVMLLN